MKDIKDLTKLYNCIQYFSRALTGRYGESSGKLSVNKKGLGTITLTFKNITDADVEFCQKMLEAGVRLAHGDHVEGFPEREDTFDN